MSRRTIFIILALVLVAVIAAIALGNRKEEGTRVFAEEVKTRSIQETVSASGKVFPEFEVKISSDVSGEIVELYVEEGDSVVMGQLLAKIDPDAYQSQVQRGMASVNSAKAQQANSQAQVEQARGQREQIQAQLANAREVYQRSQQLRKDGVISEADLQSAESSYRALEANLRSAEATVRSAEQSVKAADFNIQGAQATLNELRTSLRRTTIQAPASGVISMLPVEQGERVVGTVQMTGTEIMRIADLSKMEVRVEVSETDIPRVKLGDKAEVEVDAYIGRKFIGTVTEIANSSTTAAAAGGMINNDQVTNFEVTISIDPASYQDLITAQKPYPFRPGMSAGVDILTERKDNILTLPIQAVTTRERERDDSTDTKAVTVRDELLEVVFIVSADTVQMVSVTTGIQDADYIEITSGLTAGQQVVAGPYDAVSRELKAGNKIVVVTEEEYYQNEKQE